MDVLLHGHYDRPGNGSFTPKSHGLWHHTMAHALFPTYLHSFDGSIAMEEQRPLIGKSYAANQRTPWGFKTIVLKTAPKRPFLDTKSAIERAKRLKTTGKVLVVMCICSSFELLGCRF